MESIDADAVKETPSKMNPDMRWYTFDEEKLAEVRKQCPWKNDPKFFKRVVLSPSAVMKMVCFCVFTIQSKVSSYSFFVVVRFLSIFPFVLVS